MAVTLAELKVFLDADTPATGKIRAANDEIRNTGAATSEAEPKAAGFFGKIAGGALEFAKAVPGFGMMAGAVGDLATSLVSGNTEFERYETQFGVLLGSADAAKERIAELAQFGASTPFDLPGVVRADKILQGFGLHSEESARKFKFSGEQIRTIAGDVASGTGSSFEEMSLLLGKFSAGATGEAISRMAELGIASRDDLKKMGLEFDKSGALLSPLPQAMTTVLTLMKNKYGGMMEAQSATFEGMLSNLGDWIEGTKRQLMQPVFEVLKEKLGDFLAFVGTDEFKNSLSAFADGAAAAIGNLVSWITTLLGVITPVVGEVLHWVQVGADLVGIFIQMFTTGESVGDEWERLGDGLSGLANVAADAGGWLNDMAALFGILFTGVNNINPDLDGLAGYLIQLEAPFATIHDSIVEVINGFSEGGLGGAISAFTANIPNFVEAFMQIEGIIWQQAGAWGEALIAWIAPMIPPLLQQLAEWGGAIFNWIVNTGIPTLTTFLLDMGKKLWDWIGPMIPPAIAQLMEWAGQLGSWLLNTGIPNFVGFVGQMAVKLWDWIAPMIPPAIQKLMEWGQAIDNWIVNTAIPNIWNFLVQMGQKLAAWIGPMIPPALQALGEFMAAAGNWIINTGIPKLWAWLQEMGGKLWAWIGPQIGPMLGEMLHFMADLGGWILTEGLPKLIGFLAGLAVRLVMWISEAIPQAQAALQDFFQHLWTDLTTSLAPKTNQSFLDMAGGIIHGIAEGLGNGAIAIGQAVEKMVGNLIDSFKAGLGINSPSTVFLEMAGHIIDGLVNGIRDNMDRVLNAAHELAMQLPEPIREALGIHSPAEETQSMGSFIMEGLTLGIEGGRAALQTTVTGIAELLTAWAVNTRAAVTEALSTLPVVFQTGLQALYPVFNQVFGGGPGSLGWMIFGHDPKSFLPMLTALTTELFALYVGQGGPWVTGLHNLQTNFANALSEMAAATRPEAQQIGIAVGEGIRDGIASIVAAVAAEAASAVQAAIAAARAAADSHSPSRKAYDLIGVPIMQGFKNAITDHTPNIADAMASSVNTVLAAPSGLATGSAGAGGGNVYNITVPVTVTGLTGDITNPTTWMGSGVARAISVAIEAEVGS